ncbi:hypothetical protein E2C01_086804 [Portunus trituberculatus]|uniref:Uncharacterized protein n=1 Tax=Portunus trituberculatus TaxID=210409 RepID=A0A5B7JEG0_PORTR|nr:hypothetical protein [Portunus trituberculatus]
MVTSRTSVSCRCRGTAAEDLDNSASTLSVGVSHGDPVPSHCPMPRQEPRTLSWPLGERRRYLA